MDGPTLNETKPSTTASQVVPPPEGEKFNPQDEELKMEAPPSEPASYTETSVLAPTDPPKLAVVTDIEIPQSFNFPSSPPASSSALKPRYNAAVLDEFDPLAAPTKSEKSPRGGQPSPKLGQPSPRLGQPSPRLGQPSPRLAQQPLKPDQSSRADAEQRPATPTSAPATVATFPSIASIARSFISRPSSPVTSARPDLPNPSLAGAATNLPPQSPSTRHKPTQSSALSTSTAAPAGAVAEPANHDPEQFDFPRFLDQLKSRPADPVARYLRRYVLGVLVCGWVCTN